MRLEPTATGGVLRAVATGCLRVDATCDAAGQGAHDPLARVEARLALLPALRRPPDAAFVAASGVAAGAAFAARNVGGVALWTGMSFSSSRGRPSGVKPLTTFIVSP